MGGEFGQWGEWNHDTSLDWNLLEWPSHRGVQQMVDDLNRIYRNEPALHQGDCEGYGFEWIDANNGDQSVTAFLRKGREKNDVLLIVMNYTPVLRNNYRIGLPIGGTWKEIFNSDSKEFWGTGDVFNPDIKAEKVNKDDKWYKLKIHLPALSAVVIR